jgi:hypothetical protein
MKILQPGWESPPGWEFDNETIASRIAKLKKKRDWALWTTRNKFSIEAKFPSRPANSIFKMNVFLQIWRPLQKPEALPMLDEAATKLKEIYAFLAS